jgi:hypothetical protein
VEVVKRLQIVLLGPGEGAASRDFDGGQRPRLS